MSFARGRVERKSELYKIFAFLGRYANQPIRDLLDMPISMLRELVREVGTLIKEEGDAARAAAQSKGR